MVHVEQLYTPCMAEAAYLIVSGGEAAVVDPLRDPAPYLALAAKHNATIKYVIETHFHADFVSGHVDLAKAAGGAKIVYGPTAKPDFDALIVEDGQELKLGDVVLRALHTPGHTMESACFVLVNEAGKQQCVFTGDTLFIDDVGRPDLAQKAADMTSEQLAALLFKSLREKVMALPDDIVVYPGHGAGSPCGKAMSNETSDTLGNQKLKNYALRADMTEAEFVAEVLAGQGKAPTYFAAEVAKNKEAPAADHDFAHVLAAGKTELSPDQVEKAIAGGTLVFDSRCGDDFCAGHVPKTLFAGLEGKMVMWVSRAVPDVNQPYAVIAEDDEKVVETVTRLARIGFDNCLGHLKGGVAAWTAAGKPLAKVESVAPAVFAETVESVQHADIRGGGEYTGTHLPGSKHRPLCGGMSSDIGCLDAAAPAYVYCAGGYRSVMFISNMKRGGYAGELVNVLGGFGAIQEVPKLAALATAGGAPACASSCSKK